MDLSAVFSSIKQTTQGLDCGIHPMIITHPIGLFLFSNIHFRETIKLLRIGIRLKRPLVLILQSNPKRNVGYMGSQQWYEIQHCQQ